ncbi:dual specificity protein kinase TTK [Onthophagus taurus]|uniref:dual specificity protein kinase TTK n=1 Tax=Onthophagus taurus TaxID=166361 RepID=UPI0039BDA814
MNGNLNNIQNGDKILKDITLIPNSNDNQAIAMPLSAFQQELEEAANEPLFNNVQGDEKLADCSYTSEIDAADELDVANTSFCEDDNLSSSSNTPIKPQFLTPLINKPNKYVGFTPKLTEIHENVKSTNFMQTPNNILLGLDKKPILKNFMTCSRLKDLRNVPSDDLKLSRKLNMSVDGIIERADQISFKHLHDEKRIPLNKAELVEPFKTPKSEYRAGQNLIQHAGVVYSSQKSDKENVLNQLTSVPKLSIKNSLQSEKKFLASLKDEKITKNIPDTKPVLKVTSNVVNQNSQRENHQNENSKKENLNKICTVSTNNNLQQFDEIIVNNIKYLVLNELGKGGSSVVYLCYNMDKKVHRAIKKVNLRGDKLCVEGYINEVRMIHKLQNCDRIIKMYSYEIIKSEKVLYIVMESGDQDLSSILKDLCSNTTHLPIYILIYYWMEMLFAVKQIHENGIIHSDLKPANFLAVRGKLKLIDFGIASTVEHDMTSVVKNVQIGSFNYISPEALHNNSRDTQKAEFKISYKSDVWSLGCILYQFVYGKTPFQHIGNMYAKLGAILDPDQKINYPEANWVPSKIISTIKDCLKYDMKSRPSIDELINQYDIHV